MYQGIIWSTQIRVTEWDCMLSFNSINYSGHKTITELSQESDKQFACMNKAPEDRVLTGALENSTFCDKSKGECKKSPGHKWRSIQDERSLGECSVDTLSQ